MDIVADEVYGRVEGALEGETGLRYLTVRGSRLNGQVLMTRVSSKPLEGIWLDELKSLAEGLINRIPGACGARWKQRQGNVLLKGQRRCSWYDDCKRRNVWF